MSKKRESISIIIHKWLLLCVVLAFAVTTIITYVSNTSLSKQNTEKVLFNALWDMNMCFYESDSLTVTEMAKDCRRQVGKYLDCVINGWPDTSDNNEKFRQDLIEFCEMNSLDELNLIDSMGIIRASNVKENINFDMASTPHSAEFLCLLHPGPESKDSVYLQKLQARGFDNDVLCRYVALANDTFPNGIIQIGLNLELCAEWNRIYHETGARYARIGEKGFMYFFDNELKVVSAPDGKTDTCAMQLGIKEELLRENMYKMFETSIEDVPCYAMCCFHDGYYILAAQPVAEATVARDNTVLISTLMVFVIFLLLFLIIYWLIRVLVVKSIDTVNSSLSRITEGNLMEIVNVRNTREFDSLSTYINSTVDRLKQFIHEAETRMDADLAMGKSIQLASLPSVFPAYPERKEFDVYAGMTAAKEVGGDFYDFFFVNEHQLVFLIADVSGKGIPAALFMMRCKAALKDNASTERPLDEVCMDVNNSLCEGNETNTFFTAWVGIIDLRTGLVTYINAGHNAPLYRQTDGTFAYLDCQPNIPMAVFPDFEYQVQTLQLHPGDEIFLYTDGVTEATNVRNELYGDDRLLHTFNSMTLQVAASPESIYRHILKDVQDFAAGAEQSDDITMLCLRYEGLK